MSASIKLSTIAQACGLSVSTVSLALRHSPKIPTETQQRVQKVATELGYCPNRSLSRVMSEIRNHERIAFRETLGYLTANEDRFEKYIYAGVKQRAQEIGYGIDRFVIDMDSPELPTLQRTLTARGIRGLILAPFKEAETTLTLDWQRLSGVSIGYTLKRPQLTRVARDLVHSIHAIFSQLLARGYHRIGFVMEEKHEARMDYHNLSGFLLHAWQLPRKQRIQPLISTPLTRSLFTSWFNKQKPDIVVTMEHAVLTWLKDLAVNVPANTGVFVLNALSSKSQLSGIYPDYEGLGASAVEQVSSLVERGEFGIPKSEKTLLVNGIWVEGTTILPRGMKRGHQFAGY